MKITRENLLLLGRVMFGLVFIGFGYLHLLSGKNMVTLIPKYIPGEALYWIYLTGFCMILAGVSFVFNKATWATGVCLATMLGIFVVAVQIPMLSKNPMALGNILKDIALAGGALIIAGMDTDFIYDDNKSSPKKIVQQKVRQIIGKKKKR